MGVFECTVGVPVSQKLARTVGVVYIWSATGLPSWASFNSDTGFITGVPTQTGSFIVSVRSDGPVSSFRPDGFLVENVEIRVAAYENYTTPIIASGQVFIGKVDDAFSQTIAILNSATQPALSFAIVSGALPGGLSLNSATGAITGTPYPHFGAFTLSLQATGTNGAGPVIPVTFNIAAAAPIILDDFIDGSVGYLSVYLDSLALSNPQGRPVTGYNATGLPSWATYSNKFLSGTPPDMGDFPISVTAIGPGGSTTKTLTIRIGQGEPIITPNQVFNGKVGEAFLNTPTIEDPLDRPVFKWEVFNNGAMPSGLILNATTGQISGTPTTRGSFTVNLVAFASAAMAAANNGSRENIQINIGDGVPIINAEQFFTAQAGVLLQKTVAVTDFNNRRITSWSATGLPSGLVISDSGEIRGTPQDTGIFSLTITATGLGGSDTKTASLKIVAGAPIIVSNQRFTGKVGELFFVAQLQLVDAEDRPATSWASAIDILNPTAPIFPQGVSLKSLTGEISGTPQQAGLFFPRIRATGPGGQSNIQVIRIEINAGAPAITPGQIFNGKIGTAFNSVPVIQNSANRPVTAWAATGLPAGLSINAATGQITGTPTAEGTTTATITATGPGGSSSEEITFLVIDSFPLYRGATSGQAIYAGATEGKAIYYGAQKLWP